MLQARIMEISKFGGPGVLTLKTESVADPGPDEVVIRVKAIGLNFADIFERMGLYAAAPKAPFVPGFEAAGVVAAVGEKVTAFQPGEDVLAVTRFGGYKTVLRVRQQFVRRRPAGFSYAEAAGFPTTYLTAYHGMLNLGHLQAGERVLIHAAAGGVGTAAVQIAQLVGAEIFATCGSQVKMKFLREMGVEHILNYREQNFEKEIRAITAGGGVDVILDSIGGKTFRQGYRLLNPMGRLVIFGLGELMPTGGRPNWLKLAWRYLRLPRITPFKMIPDNKTISAFHLAYMFQFLTHFESAISQLMVWAEAGKVKTVVDRTFPFEEAGAAQTYLQSRQSIGKVVLTVD